MRNFLDVPWLDFGPFALLPPEARDRLASHGRPLRVGEGQLVLREGADPAGAYVLLEGTLRVLAAGEDRTLAIVTPPALVGEMAILERRPSSATLVADTPCTLLFIAGDALREAMAGEPAFAAALRERVDLLLADTFLKRRSPLRELPGDILSSLVRELRPRTLAAGQLLEAQAGGLYLVRRGSLQRLGDDEPTSAGEFVQPAAGDRLAAVEETWIYELRAADVMRHVDRHQARLRAILNGLRDEDRVRARPGVSIRPGPETGEAIVYDGRQRAMVPRAVADVVSLCDGSRDLREIGEAAGLARDALRLNIATLIASDLVSVRRRRRFGLTRR